MDRVIAAEAAARDTTVAAVRRGYTEQVSMRTLVDPADIAAAVVFLSSDSARFVNGQVVSIDGHTETLRTVRLGELADACCRPTTREPLPRLSGRASVFPPLRLLRGVEPLHRAGPIEYALVGGNQPVAFHCRRDDDAVGRIWGQVGQSRRASADLAVDWHLDQPLTKLFPTPQCNVFGKPDPTLGLEQCNLPEGDCGDGHLVGLPRPIQ